MNNYLINGRVAPTIVDYRWRSRIILQPLGLKVGRAFVFYSMDLQSK